MAASVGRYISLVGACSLAACAENRGIEEIPPERLLEQQLEAHKHEAPFVARFDQLAECQARPAAEVFPDEADVVWQPVVRYSIAEVVFADPALGEAPFEFAVMVDDAVDLLAAGEAGDPDPLWSAPHSENSEIECGGESVGGALVLTAAPNPRGVDPDGLLNLMSERVASAGLEAIDDAYFTEQCAGCTDPLAAATD